MSISNGGAPEYGEAVELALCELEDLDHTDGAHADARDEDGTQLQIKGTQRWVDNGDGRCRGRVTVWSEPLLSLLCDGGEYLVALYDADEFDPAEDDPEDVDAEAFISEYVRVSPETVGELADGSWVEGHRPEKGEKGRFRWAELDELAEAVEAEEVEA